MWSELILHQRDDTLWVPRQAVHFQDDAVTVFVVQEGKLFTLLEALRSQPAYQGSEATGTPATVGD